MTTLQTVSEMLPLVAEFDKALTSQELFGLSLELYTGRTISNESREFIEELTPSNNLAFILRGERFLYPDNFSPVPPEVVWRTVSGIATGIFCRVVPPDESGRESSFTLCVSELGTTAGDDRLALGFIGSERWNRSFGVQEAYSNQVGRLRRFYEEFCHLKIVDNLMRRDNYFDYLVDLESLKVIASRCPGEYLQLISSLPETSPLSEDFLRTIFVNPQSKDPHQEQILPGNMNITRFQINGFDYAAISIKAPAVNRIPAEDNFHNFEQELTIKLGILQSAVEQLSMPLGHQTNESDLALLDIVRKTANEMAEFAGRLPCSTEELSLKSGGFVPSAPTVQATPRTTAGE